MSEVGVTGREGVLEKSRGKCDRKERRVLSPNGRGNGKERKGWVSKPAGLRSELKNWLFTCVNPSPAFLCTGNTCKVTSTCSRRECEIKSPYSSPELLRGYRRRIIACSSCQFSREDLRRVSETRVRENNWIGNCVTPKLPRGLVNTKACNVSDIMGKSKMSPRATWQTFASWQTDSAFRISVKSVFNHLY